MNRATRKPKKPNVTVQEDISFQTEGGQFPTMQPFQPVHQPYDPNQFIQYAPSYQPDYAQGTAASVRKFSEGESEEGFRDSVKKRSRRVSKIPLVAPSAASPAVSAPFQNQQFQPMPPQPPQHNGIFYGGGPGDQSGFQIPSQLLQPAAASMAMQFGEALVGQGKQAFDRELGRYFSVERLKYYFAVDTGYVAKKLAILTIPYTHTDWSLKYSSDEPVQPRLDVNAPDLYIPLMGYVTFILLSGITQGLQNKFAPEALGIEASSKLAWLSIEVLAVLLTLYVMNLPTTLKTFDVIAFCGYKYVGMIGILVASLLFASPGYTVAWFFYSASFMFFLVRSLKVQVQPHGGQPDVGFKRTTYLLLFMSGIQPLLMWWLTRHLAMTVAPLPLPVPV